VQENFYFRQLWAQAYVYGISNRKTMSHSHLCHEGQAKRGPNEMCSILDYITNHVSETVKELHICFLAETKATLLSDSLMGDSKISFNTFPLEDPVAGILG
jgi:hypothetical protein